MITVFDVAKYVTKKCAPMTAMKLEKLVYYCQAWSLGWDEKPLFNEDFEAWANGPVCPALFDMHRGVYTIGEDFFDKIPDAEFDEDQIETMNAVIDYYGDKDPNWLSSLTHMESPWKEARKGIPDGIRCNVVIEKDSMLEYYNGLKDE